MALGLQHQGAANRQTLGGQILAQGWLRSSSGSGEPGVRDPAGSLWVSPERRAFPDEVSQQKHILPQGLPCPPGKDTLCSEIPAGLAPWTWQGEACPLLPAGTSRPVVPEPSPGLAATASENQPMSSPKLATCTGVGPFCPFQHLHSVDVNSKFMSHWHVGVPGPGIEATPHSNPSHSSDNAGSFTL